MKKFTLFKIAFLAVTMAFAQPTPEYSFLFTGGSLTDAISSTTLTTTENTHTLIADRAGNTNDAVILNSDQLSFSGLPYSQEFTVSFFIKTTDSPLNSKPVISNRNNTTGLGYILALRQGKFEIFAGMESNLLPAPYSVNFSNIGNTSVSNDEWHHVALVVQSFQTPGNYGFFFMIYIDGYLDSQAQLATTYTNTQTYSYHRLVNTSEPFEISQDNPSFKFTDGIDDLKYFTQALSATEVATLSNEMPSCNVSIPDANFKNYLVNNTDINTNGDTEIQCSEAASYTGAINCTNMSISDLTGVEAFTEITALYCGSNFITSIDVSYNTELTQLNVNNTNISSLDISNNTLLEHLYCSETPLTALDLSNNTALTRLYCQENQLTSLDTSNNTALEYLHCNGNQLTSLDVSNNTSLTQLNVNDTDISSLDISNNTLLEYLYFNETPITVIDLSNNTSLTRLYCLDSQLVSLDTSNNTALEYLHCNGNQLTSLDVSNNTSLTQLSCYSNNLTTLNVANNNNTNMVIFYAHFNPNLECIQVDDPTYSTDNWPNIDATASFSEDCENLGIDELQQKTIKLYPNPVQTELNIELNETSEINIVNILGDIVFTKRGKTGKNIIDISRLEKGIYFLQATHRETVKFIKK